jgi:hypothetical protein
MTAVCAMAMLNPGPVYGQGYGQAGPPSIPTPTAVRGPETKVIPSLSVSERYDSNVYFVPGSNFEDYVTTVTPQLRVIHKRQLVEGMVGGGATAETYVKNSGLNYVAGNGFVDLNLDRAMGELVRGLGLRIYDAYIYTPQPPAFAAPTGGSQLSESFVEGIQARRANSHTNSGRVKLSYAPSPVLTFTSTYIDRRIQFGNAVSTPTGVVQDGLINTAFQTVTSGPAVKISPLDTGTLVYQYQKGTYSTRSANNFSTHGAIAGWTRSITPALTAAVTGGAAVFSTSNDLQYLGSAFLGWKGENTDLTLSYSRNIAPSFYVTATALLSQVVTGTVTYRPTGSLALSLNANYAESHSVPDSSTLKFESYSVTPRVNYEINRVMTATLSYTHSEFQRTFSSQEYQFDRNIVLLRLVAEWE